MIGIDVGSTTVTATSDDGLHRRPHSAPHELVCRVGDDVPCVLLTDDGFELRTAHEVFADAVRDTLTAIRRDRDGSQAPAAVAVPGWWTPRALGWVGEALESRGLGDVLLVNDGEAAVLGHRAAGGTVPGTVAVVSLGAELSGVVIVEQCTTTPRAVRSPALVHVEGGQRLDGAVLHHLVTGLEQLGVAVDRHDPETVEAARTVLDQCRDVRERLTASAVESLQPDLPGTDVRLRLVRSELEELAEPWVDAVVRMVATAFEQYPGEIESVLLVGGLAAMPLVSQRLSADLGTDVVVADDPVSVVARGASTRAVPVRVEEPRKSWRRRGVATAGTKAASPTEGRRRSRRRATDEVAAAIDDNPAIAALPAAPSAPAAPDAPAAQTEEPRAPRRQDPTVQHPTPEEHPQLPTLAPVPDLAPSGGHDDSPTSLPRGQHVAAASLPGQSLDPEDAAGAHRGRRAARTASVR